MVKNALKSNSRRELIYVIAGKGECLVNARCSELVGQLLEPEQRTLGLFDANPAEVAVSAILDELRTLPFLTERRVVVVKRADDFVSDNRRLLEGYFDNPSPTGILILTVNKWDSRTKLAKKLPRVGKLIIAAEPKPSELPRRLMQYCTDAHDKELTRDAAGLLIELTGEITALLYNELDKLALFAASDKAIQVGHVESLTGQNRLFNAFGVIDAMVDGNASEAVGRLRNLLAGDKSAGYTLVGAFAFHFRRMFNAKVLLERGVSVSHIAEKLRIWSNKKAYFARLRGMSLSQIGSMLEGLAQTDYAIKTGQANAETAIEQLVLKAAAG